VRRPERPTTPIDSTPTRNVVTRDTAASAPATAPAATPTQPVQQPVTPPPEVGQAAAPLSSVRVDSAPPRVVVPTENPRTAAAAIVDAYARAIATRDVDQLKRVYPAMSASQESAWQSFFSSVRSMTANLQIDSFSTEADSAVARVTGAYEFVTRSGRSERQPASFQATFQKDGERWRLLTVR
jgi:hypothetical protein